MNETGSAIPVELNKSLTEGESVQHQVRVWNWKILRIIRLYSCWLFKKGSSWKSMERDWAPSDDWKESVKQFLNSILADLVSMYKWRPRSAGGCSSLTTFLVIPLWRSLYNLFLTSQRRWFSHLQLRAVYQRFQAFTDSPLSSRLTNSHPKQTSAK